MAANSLGSAPTNAARVLIDALDLDRLISIVDIGANPLDGMPPPYKPLLHNGIGRLTGFEPQAKGLAQLVAAKRSHETYLPYAVGDGAEHRLHLCNAPGMASLLRPDPATLALFHGFPDWGKVIETQPIVTRRLDEIEEVDRIDYLKIDVQGSELSVFEGGRDKLRSAMAIHTEVSFVPLYLNQPVFGEIDLSLRSLGFLPHAFVEINRRAIVPVLIDNDVYRGLNQLLEADIVYVRDFRRPEKLSDEQLKVLAAIAYCCYGSFDLAIHCLLRLAERSAVAADAAPTFFDALNVAAPTPGPAA
jgi:FkbM family methyltransferase